MTLLIEQKQAQSQRAAGGDPIAALDIWREAWFIVRRYPLATILPAVALGFLTEALALIGDSRLTDQTSTNLATAFVYYLYVAYAENVVESIRGVDNASILGRLRGPLQLVPVALRMLAAAIVLVGLIVATMVAAVLAAGAVSEIGVTDLVTVVLFLLLLLLPVLWLLTRLSLFAPALSREHLGPLAALKRSNELVRHYFWLIFWTATLALLLEEFADEPVALAADLSFGPYGVWISGSIVTGLVMPLAAFTTSLAYHRVLEHKRWLSSEAHLGEEHIGGEDIPQRSQPITGGADLITAHTSGLSADEVGARKARGEVNAPPPPPGRTYRQIIVGNVFSFINNVFYALCLLLVLLGRPFDAILPMAVVLANVAVSVFQEVRAKRKLDEIALLTRPTAKVIRDGREQDVDPAEIVRGDLLMVGPGDQIVVDGAVGGGGTMEVDESQLTGESDLVRKREGDQVFSGSFCVTGSAHYEAQRIGAASFANQVTAGARAERRVLTPLQREINGMIRLMILVAGFLMVVLTVSAFAYRTPFVELVQSLVVVIGLVPQGLLLAIVVAYALGAMRVAGQGALVQQTNAIESLSNVDTFCLDKTGTLTTNRLQVQDIRPLGIDRGDLQRRLSDFVASTTTGNKTSEAIAQALPGEKQPVTDEVPFSSARKWSALVFDGQEEGISEEPAAATDGTAAPNLPAPHSLRGVYVLGAPEMLRSHLRQGAELDGHGEEWAARGLRVLLFAYQPEPVPLHDGADEVRDPQGLIPLGLVGLTDELRPRAYETLTAFARAGVDLKIISGDNPETVKALAVQAGFDPQAKLISGPELDRLDDGPFAAAAVEHGVFGRITPEQKERLVRALNGQGHYVAMTGDGVNDVLSLKQANLGIAMQSGSQATRGVADIVLTNDSFAVLPQAISEGQRIIAGMQNVLKLFLSRTFFVALLIIAIGIVIDFPFSPRQSALLSFLTAGVPAVALAAWAQPVRATHGSSLGRLASFAVPAGLAVTLVGLLLFVGYSIPVFDLFANGSATVEEANAALKDTLPRAQTVLTYFLAVCGLLLVIFIEPPSRFWAGGDKFSGDRRPTWLTIALLVGLLAIAFVPGLSELFDLRPIALPDMAVVGVAAAVWMFLVRWAWKHRFLERFLGISSAP
jgi:cation-transporting P-type ATPase E